MYSCTHVIGIHLATYVSKSDPFRRGLSLIIFILGNALCIIICWILVTRLTMTSTGYYCSGSPLEPSIYMVCGLLHQISEHHGNIIQTQQVTVHSPHDCQSLHLDRNQGNAIRVWSIHSWWVPKKLTIGTCVYNG